MEEKGIIGSKKILLDESYFRCFYIIVLYLSLFCVIEPVCNVIANICLGWALVLYIHRVRKEDGLLKIHFSLWILLFLGAGLITIVLRDKENALSGLLQLYQAAVMFFMLYGMENCDHVRAECQWIFKVISVLTGIASLAGLIIFLSIGEFQVLWYTIGTYEGNRFTGLYTNPNLAAFASVVGITCTHLLYHKTFVKSYIQKDIPKYIYVLSIILNFISLMLSDSNAAMIFFVVYGAMILLLRLLEKNDRMSLKALFSFMVMLSVIFVVVASIRYLGERGITAILDEDIGRSFERDLTTGRIIVWKQALEVFWRYPLWGIGRANIMEYGDVYLENGFRYFDIHNGYLTILLSNGLIGFCMFLIFAVKVIKYLWKKLVSCKNLKDRYLPYFLAFLAAYCVYAFFERTLMYDNSFMVAVFWLILGYAMNGPYGESDVDIKE